MLDRLSSTGGIAAAMVPGIVVIALMARTGMVKIDGTFKPEAALLRHEPFAQQGGESQQVSSLQLQ